MLRGLKAGRVRTVLAAEEGFALPLAMAILVLSGLLVFATITFATHNTDRANRDRDSVRAAQAADAGVDSALYRLNKALTASKVDGLLGLPVAAIAETACIEVNVGQLLAVDATGDWCGAAGSSEQVDGPVAGGPGWQPAGYSFFVSTGTNIGSDPANSGSNLVERRIVSTGVVGDVSERVMATVRLSIRPTGALLSLFEQIGYTTCTPEPPDPSDPASGC